MSAPRMHGHYPSTIRLSIPQRLGFINALLEGVLAGVRASAAPLLRPAQGGWNSYRSGRITPVRDLAFEGTSIEHLVELASNAGLSFVLVAIASRSRARSTAADGALRLCDIQSSVT